MGQQAPYIFANGQTQAWMNPAIVPALYFTDDQNLLVQSTYRAQWISQPETPRTLQLAASFIPDWGDRFHLLAGALLLQDRTGPIGVTDINGRIGAILNAGDRHYFSLADTFGQSQFQFDAGRVNWLHDNDALVPAYSFTANRPDLGIGVYYYLKLDPQGLNKNNLYLGAAVPQVLGANWKVNTGERITPLGQELHLFGQAGWLHFFSDASFFELAAQTRYTKGAPLNLDIIAKIQPIRTLILGGGYNLNGWVHLQGGLNVPGLFAEASVFCIGYAFGYNTSVFNLRLGSSHEITLSISLGTNHY